jgi:cellulose biosynthesis protein BcsQ
MSRNHHQTPTIIEFTGADTAGKTTLAIALSDELAPASILLVDASPDQKLTQLLAPQDPPLTLAQVLTQKHTGTREATDWAFNDLTVNVGEENDLLTVGALDATLGVSERERLRYGLTRLADAYDYVIIDGYHPLLHQLLPDENMRILMILTPGQLTSWALPGTGESVATPSLILNQYSDEPLPDDLEAALTQGNARLVGKLPRYATSEACQKQLPDDFRNCLLRLNIPVNFSPS